MSVGSTTWPVNYIRAIGFTDGDKSKRFKVEFIKDDQGRWDWLSDSRISGIPNHSLVDDHEFHSGEATNEPLQDDSTPDYMKYKWFREKDENGETLDWEQLRFNAEKHSWEFFHVYCESMGDDASSDLYDESLEENANSDVEMEDIAEPVDVGAWLKEVQVGKKPE
ncbi:uncharacterized protein I206_100837 [Kwoniella pini CBS 10737]|uniref:Uncharacterized protein n=1 Tax=Kwoniella pini CBS 10737 TaxID=1296096 RepID=A0A1B9IC07_9TREE|nr:uncharacterized protein I206_00489 [Kwoniella pini CBS 10737]OCF53188.1 hypothetical protein I206_00489 [Kwoniella pini CBS 10737]